MRLRGAAAPIDLSAVTFPPFLLGEGIDADGKTGLKMWKWAFLASEPLLDWKSQRWMGVVMGNVPAIPSGSFCCSGRGSPAHGGSALRHSRG